MYDCLKMTRTQRVELYFPFVWMFRLISSRMLSVSLALSHYQVPLPSSAAAVYLYFPLCPLLYLSSNPRSGRAAANYQGAKREEGA